jgi:hypothetical protein
MRFGNEFGGEKIEEIVESNLMEVGEVLIVHGEPLRELQ